MSNKSIDLPEQLQLQVRELVEQGWFGSEGQVVQEAVRRFLEAHRPELMARFIREDIEWGLQGDE